MASTPCLHPSPVEVKETDIKLEFLDEHNRRVWSETSGCVHSVLKTVVFLSVTPCSLAVARVC